MGMLYNTNWLVRDFEFKKGVRLVGSMISRGGDLKTTRLVVVFYSRCRCLFLWIFSNLNIETFPSLNQLCTGKSNSWVG